MLFTVDNNASSYVNIHLENPVCACFGLSFLQITAVLKHTVANTKNKQFSLWKCRLQFAFGFSPAVLYGVLLEAVSCSVGVEEKSIEGQWGCGDSHAHGFAASASGRPWHLSSSIRKKLPLRFLSTTVRSWKIYKVFNWILTAEHTVAPAHLWNNNRIWISAISLRCLSSLLTTLHPWVTHLRCVCAQVNLILWCQQPLETSSRQMQQQPPPLCMRTQACGADLLT